MNNSKVKLDYLDQLKEQKNILKNQCNNYEILREKFYRGKEDVFLGYFDSILENQSYHLKNTVFDKLFLDTSSNLRYTKIVVNVGKEEYEIGTIKLERELFGNDEGFKKYTNIGIDTYSTLNINSVERDKFIVLGVLSRLIGNIETVMLNRLNNDEKEYMNSMSKLNSEIRNSRSWVREIESKIRKLSEQQLLEDLEVGIEFEVNKESDLHPLPTVSVRKSKNVSQVKYLKILDYGPSGKTVKLKVIQHLPTGEYQEIWNRVNIENLLFEMVNQYNGNVHSYTVKPNEFELV